MREAVGAKDYLDEKELRTVRPLVSGWHDSLCSPCGYHTFPVDYADHNCCLSILSPLFLGSDWKKVSMIFSKGMPTCRLPYFFQILFSPFHFSSMFDKIKISDYTQCQELFEKRLKCENRRIFQNDGNQCVYTALLRE